MMKSFQIKKNDFHNSRWLETSIPEAGAGQILLKVDRFAFTANNITYAAYGDVLGYWLFYPASDGWGQIPVWGFADVLSSQVDGISPGERLFGYWPMSTHAVLTPKQVDDHTVVEGAQQRQQLNPFYNRYQRCATDPGYRADQEDWQSIFRPLALTGFLMDEYLAENRYWDAEHVLLSSASSKTATAIAHYLHERAQCKVIGLTSEGNLDFVHSLDCYDEVLAYSDVESLSQDTPSVFVDMAGDANVQMSVHTQLGAHLKHSITVGGTHWTEIRPGLPLPGPAPEFFFAPDQIVRRLSEWGPSDVQKRFGDAWLSLMPRVQKGIQLVQGTGAAATEDVYRAFLEGTAPADRGYTLKI